MHNIDLLSDLKVKVDTKILLFVMDGLGGLPGPGGLTELEAAKTPNLDALAKKGVSGLIDPVARGITPGSGPGHLGLFGYNPLEHMIGRGALEAAGIGFDLQRKDVATRFNFCTLDKNGNITDRRAGRISTDINKKMVEKMRNISLPGIEVFVETVKEHRGIAIFRKEGLKGNLHDTDPQRLGVPPLKAVTSDGGKSQEMADHANLWLAKVYEVLKNESPANGILTRGWCNYPEIPTYQEVYGLNPACIALYPMYRGVAQFAGMKVYTEGIKDFATKVDVLKNVWGDHDFFFFHYKHTDSAGEDGDFNRKVACIEEVDQALPCILENKPDVIAITGDHSTPSVIKAHSWHPVPILMAGTYIRPDAVSSFGERAAISGGLGRFNACYIINELLAAGGRITKYGA
ncbi:MAG: 2,3-bisphosphoglycerate-independent phosphoglycerate mutase [Candidatus Latescibacteria bacterium]|nr:2,3-bisphosphoglycerate-independent phosphoglycerate mutase [Candidatus Latescibacterota bacterium]